MIKKFISFYKPYKMLFTLDLIVAFIASLCDLVYPMMTRDLINESIPNKDIRMIVVFAIAAYNFCYKSSMSDIYAILWTCYGS